MTDLCIKLRLLVAMTDGGSATRRGHCAVRIEEFNRRVTSEFVRVTRNLDCLGDPLRRCPDSGGAKEESFTRGTIRVPACVPPDAVIGAAYRRAKGGGGAGECPPLCER